MRNYTYAYLAGQVSINDNDGNDGVCPACQQPRFTSHNFRHCCGCAACHCHAHRLIRSQLLLGVSLGTILEEADLRHKWHRDTGDDYDSDDFHDDLSTRPQLKGDGTVLSQYSSSSEDDCSSDDGSSESC